MRSDLAVHLVRPIGCVLVDQCLSVSARSFLAGCDHVGYQSLRVLWIIFTIALGRELQIMIDTSGIGGNQQTHKESIRAQTVLSYLNVIGVDAQIGFIWIQPPCAYNG